MSSKRKQWGIKSERRREKRERQEKIKTAASLLNLNMSLAPRVRTGGGYGRAKLPPPSGCSSLFCTSPLSKGPNLSDARQFCPWSQINKVVIWKLAPCLKNLRYGAINFGDHFFASPKKGETAVYGYNPALFWVLSVSCWCLAELIFT